MFYQYYSILLVTAALLLLGCTNYKFCHTHDECHGGTCVNGKCVANDLLIGRAPKDDESGTDDFDHETDTTDRGGPDSLPNGDPDSEIENGTSSDAGNPEETVVPASDTQVDVHKADTVNNETDSGVKRGRDSAADDDSVSATDGDSESVAETEEPVDAQISGVPSDSDTDTVVDAYGTDTAVDAYSIDTVGKVTDSDDGDGMTMNIQPDTSSDAGTNPMPFLPVDIATHPSDGQQYVSEDESIVISFNKPMNTQVTESAISIDHVMEDTVEPVTIHNFSWHDDATRVTLSTEPFAVETADVVNTNEVWVPVEPFEVPPEILNLRSHEYRITISRDAMRLDGAPLTAEVTSSFYTKKKVIHRFSRLRDDLDNLYGHNVGDTGDWTFIGAGGDDEGQEALGFMTFHLFGISEEIRKIKKASFITYVWDMINNPFELYGDLHIEHIIFPDKFNGYYADPLRDLGPILLAAENPQLLDVFEFDVTDALQEDYDNRVERLYRSQYRFRFPDYYPGNVWNIFYLFHKPSHVSDINMAEPWGRDMEEFSQFPILTIEYELE